MAHATTTMDQAGRRDPDRLLQEIADYALGARIDSAEAWQTARYCLLDALGCGLLLLASTRQRVLGGAEGEAKPAAGPRYTVIETQGFNLLVTDNAANKLYYYATDKDVPPGSPLKLRASLDLSQVGKEEIKITPHNLENIRKKDDK